MKAKIGITVLAVIFTLANSSCEYTGTQISKRVIIKVVNSEGKNMFDSTTPNAINIDSIKIYRRLTNGDTIAAENDYDIEANKGKGILFFGTAQIFMFLCNRSNDKTSRIGNNGSLVYHVVYTLELQRFRYYRY